MSAMVVMGALLVLGGQRGLMVASISTLQRCWRRDDAARPDFASIVSELRAWTPVVSALRDVGETDALDMLIRRK